VIDECTHHCGLFGVYNNPRAAELTFLGLYSLQHRGEEAAGIVSGDGRQLYQHVGLGLVSDVFNRANLDRLVGRQSIGHVRYSTTGSSVLKNAQPFLANFSLGTIAVAHNGNLIDVRRRKDDLENKGSIFQTGMDSELIMHLIARSYGNSIEERIEQALQQIKGAFCFLFLTPDKMIAVRDPYGIRPLCLGKLGDSTIISSETAALNLAGAEYVRDIEPGEMVTISKNGVTSANPFPKKKHSFCIFELIYFAKPDSRVFTRNVYMTRKALGHQLAREAPCDADMVIPVPDSANYAAIGYAQEAGIPLELGIIRNHYIGRTFIQPSQFIREFGVKVKLAAVHELIKGKRLCLIEDSIVRGTTTRTKIHELRKAGAKEIHMRISSQPIRFPCFYGIDFCSEEELIANKMSVEQIRDYLELDSLVYLSYDGMMEAAAGEGPPSFCSACFNGNYPITVSAGANKYILEQ